MFIENEKDLVKDTNKKSWNEIIAKKKSYILFYTSKDVCECHTHDL